MEAGTRFNRLPTAIVCAVLTIWAAGCRSVYSIRMDVRGGAEEGFSTVPLPLEGAEDTVPISGAHVRLRLPWYWHYTGPGLTDADGLLLAWTKDPDGVIQQAWRRWFPKTPDERIVHFTCECVGYHPVAGVFRLNDFRTHSETPAKTVLVVLVPSGSSPR